MLRLCAHTHLLGIIMSVSPFFTTPASLLPITTVPMSLQDRQAGCAGCAGRCMQQLRGQGRFPKHGLACFAGHGEWAEEVLCTAVDCAC